MNTPIAPNIQILFLFTNDLTWTQNRC